MITITDILNMMTVIIAAVYLNRRLNNGDHHVDPLVSSAAAIDRNSEEEYFGDISLLSDTLDLEDIENIDPLVGTDRLITSTPTLPVSPEPMGCPIAGYSNGFMDYQPGPSRHATPRSNRNPLEEVRMFHNICKQFSLFSSF